MKAERLKVWESLNDWLGGRKTKEQKDRFEKPTKLKNFHDENMFEILEFEEPPVLN